MRHVISAILLLSLASTLSAQRTKPREPAVTKEAIRAYVASLDNEAVLRSLDESLYSESEEDIELNWMLLEAVRNRRLDQARDELEAFLEQLKSPRKPSLKKVDPQRAIEYHVRATLLSLGMNERGLDTVADRAAYLFAAVERKLELGGDAINAEMILLRDDADGMTEMLLHMLDTQGDRRMREIALDVARSSGDARIEEGILNRLTRIRAGDPALFDRMLGTLSEIGSDKTLDYFAELLGEEADDVRAAALACLRLLAKNAHSEEVREGAWRLLARQAGEQQPASEPVRESGAPFNGAERSEVPREEMGPAFARPEELGDDLSSLSPSQLVRHLGAPYDETAIRRAAKVLGDRAIAGELGLSPASEAIIAETVHRCVEMCASDDPSVRSEGRIVIQYLWGLATPALLDELDNELPCVGETAARSLSLLCDEATVWAIVGRARAATNEEQRATALLALKGMRYDGKPVVPGRPTLNADARRALYEGVALPAIRELEAK